MIITPGNEIGDRLRVAIQAVLSDLKPGDEVNGVMAVLAGSLASIAARCGVEQSEIVKKFTDIASQVYARRRPT